MTEAVIGAARKNSGKNFVMESVAKTRPRTRTTTPRMTNDITQFLMLRLSTSVGAEGLAILRFKNK